MDTSVALPADLLAIIGKKLTYLEACTEACCMEDHYPCWDDNPIMRYHRNAHVYGHNECNWIGKKLAICSKPGTPFFNIYLLDCKDPIELKQKLAKYDFKVSNAVDMSSDFPTLNWYNLEKLIDNIEENKFLKIVFPDAEIRRYVSKELFNKTGMKTLRQRLYFREQEKIDSFLDNIINHDMVIQDLKEFIQYATQNKVLMF